MPTTLSLDQIGQLITLVGSAVAVILGIANFIWMVAKFRTEKAPLIEEAKLKGATAADTISDAALSLITPMRDELRELHNLLTVQRTAAEAADKRIRELETTVGNQQRTIDQLTQANQQYAQRIDHLEKDNQRLSEDAVALSEQVESLNATPVRNVRGGKKGT